jgi:hypothetical protein
VLWQCSVAGKLATTLKRITGDNNGQRAHKGKNKAQQDCVWFHSMLEAIGGTPPFLRRWSRKMHLKWVMSP